MAVQIAENPSRAHSSIWEKSTVRRQSVSSTKVIIRPNGTTTTISYTISISLSKVSL
jgi:hypothetical protein